MSVYPTETAMPTLVPPLEVMALPSASALVSVKLSECSVNAPVPATPALTWRPSGTVALALVSTTDTATAPATLTEPPSLLDDPLSVLPVLPAAPGLALVARESAPPF